MLSEEAKAIIEQQATLAETRTDQRIYLDSLNQIAAALRRFGSSR